MATHRRKNWPRWLPWPLIGAAGGILAVVKATAAPTTVDGWLVRIILGGAGGFAAVLLGGWSLLLGLELIWGFLPLIVLPAIGGVLALAVYQGSGSAVLASGVFAVTLWLTAVVNRRWDNWTYEVANAERLWALLFGVSPSDITRCPKCGGASTEEWVDAGYSRDVTVSRRISHHSADGVETGFSEVEYPSRERVQVCKRTCNVCGHVWSY